MTQEQPAEILLRITPQQAGYLVDALNKRIPGAPFIVGPVMATRDNPFDMRIAPDANPVHITISDGTREDGHVSIMAIPAGAVMRLVDPGHAELAIHWLDLVNELRRLGAIIETARDDGPAVIDGDLKALAGEKTLEIANRRNNVLRLWRSRSPGMSKEKFKRETAAKLTISESTIRDDLRHLEDEGLLK